MLMEIRDAYKLGAAMLTHMDITSQRAATVFIIFKEQKEKNQLDETIIRYDIQVLANAITVIYKYLYTSERLKRQSNFY